MFLNNFLNISNYFVKLFSAANNVNSILTSIYFYRIILLLTFLLLLIFFPLPEHLKYPAFVGFIVLIFIIAYFTVYNFCTLDFPLEKKAIWNTDFAIGFSELIIYYMNSIPFSLQLHSTMKTPQEYSKVKI